MSDGHHLKTVKSQYLSKGLTDRQEIIIWHDDDIGPINFAMPAHTLHLLLSPHGIAMPKGLNFSSFFLLPFFAFSTPHIRIERISTKLGHVLTYDC